MLSEEALIVLAALVACGLVVLGVMELLWPTRPKHPVRRRRLPPAHNRAHGHPRHGRAGRTAPEPERSSGRQAPQGTLRPAPITRFQPSRALAPPVAAAPIAASPVATPPGAASPVATPPVADPMAADLPVADAPAAVTPAPTIAVPAVPITQPAVSKREPQAPGPVPAVEYVADTSDFRIEDSATVDACFTLYQEHRYDEVVALGMAALTEAGGPQLESHAQETAALWSIVALARQALGDDLGARAALEAAIETAPDADRATYRHQLASLALHVGQGLLAAAAGRAPGDFEERLDALRAAVAWLDGGLAAAPDDLSLHDLRTTALAALWPAYEQVVMALVQRQEFRVARRLLREALEHGDFPAARGEAFREQLSGTFSGEIGQLTAQAIRSMQDARESEALTALQRADELLGRLADEALPPKRREEVDRRLWWGYNKLGTRRLDTGQFEEALEPFFHALRFAGVGPERQAETRALLVRALEGVAEARALVIQQLADDGDREAALVQTDKLWALLRSAAAEGVSEQALSAASARVQRLLEGLGRRGPS